MCTSYRFKVVQSMHNILNGVYICVFLYICLAVCTYECEGAMHQVWGTEKSIKVPSLLLSTYSLNQGLPFFH